jgi:hypothetical protein
MMTNIVDCDPKDVRIGMDVEVVFDDVTDEVTLPKFKPAVTRKRRQCSISGSRGLTPASGEAPRALDIHIRRRFRKWHRKTHGFSMKTSK